MPPLNKPCYFPDKSSTAALYLHFQEIPQTCHVSRAVSVLALLLFAQCLSCAKQYAKMMTELAQNILAVQTSKGRKKEAGQVTWPFRAGVLLLWGDKWCRGSGDPVSGFGAPNTGKINQLQQVQQWPTKMVGGWTPISCKGLGLFSLEDDFGGTRQQLPIPMERLPRRWSLALHGSA